jgi:hypothetical protein
MLPTQESETASELAALHSKEGQKKALKNIFHLHKGQGATLAAQDLTELQQMKHLQIQEHPKVFLQLVNCPYHIYLSE